MAESSLDLFFEAFYPAAGAITRSLFEDELRRARAKSPRGGAFDPLDSVGALSTATARRVPLANEPASFPDIGSSPASARVKVRSINLHGFNESGTRAATRRRPTS
jgi:hypothetical protein